MTELLVNIDVDDLDRAVDFYTRALELRVARRFAGGMAELVGVAAKIYLLQKPAGSPALPSGAGARRYDRHWTPVHLDFAVPDLEAALARALAAGAVLEREVRRADWGSLALLADPFGHGLCLVEFTEAGYDALPRA